MMHPLLLLLFAVDLGAANAPEMPISISDINAKYLKGVQSFVEAVKSITSNISTDSRKQLILSIMLDIPGMVESPADDQKIKAIKGLELQVDEMGIAITNSLLVTKDICAEKDFEDISVQAGASFSLLMQAVLGAFDGDDTFFKIFLETHSKNKKNLPMVLQSILVMLRKPLNPMISSMEADEFHKFSTMDDTRTRILIAANTLAFVETLRSNFNNESDYNEKVRKMISAVMNDADIEGDKEKAAALMKVLTEVHTNDRFVVAVYSEDCDVKRFATVHHANQLINDPLRKVLVYRSTQAHVMTGKEPVEFTEAAKDTFGFYQCDKITAANVRRTAHVPLKLMGLVLIREIKFVCTMAIEQDPRFILPNYDNVTRCIDPTLSVRSLRDVNVIRYPE